MPDMNVDLTELLLKLSEIQAILHEQFALPEPGDSEVLGNLMALPALFFRLHVCNGRAVEFLNACLCDLTGYRPEELNHSESVALHPLIVTEDRARVRERIATAVAENRPYEVEYRVIHKDNSLRYLLERGKPFPNNGNTVVQGMILDITERKTSEIAMLQPSSVDVTATLAGGIAHDLNNLMVAVLGNSYFLKAEYQNNPTTLEIVDEIIDAGKRASVLIYQLLAYSRVGKFENRLLNLNDVIDEIIQLQNYMIPVGISLEYRPQRLPGKVQGDINQFSQVIMSLLSNAIEAIDGTGKITITTQAITVETQSSAGLVPGTYAKVCVSDTGRGMSLEVQSKIFEPFFTTKFPGRGLGLAAVASIIKSHHGHISAESSEGRGSKFTFYLPLAPSSTSEEAHNHNLMGMMTLT